MIHFRIGQKVVCIDDAQHSDMSRPILIERGQVYTVESIQTSAYGTLGLTLVEIADPWPYKARRFRPVVETDISIFTAMLVPSPKETVKA